MQRLRIILDLTDHHDGRARRCGRKKSRAAMTSLNSPSSTFRMALSPPELTKDRKRAVRKRATLLTVEKGEIFVKRGGSKVKVVAPSEERRRILKACHSEPTSGHFGVTKTYKRIAERFYWKGMIADVKELVSP